MFWKGTRHCGIWSWQPVHLRSWGPCLPGQDHTEYENLICPRTHWQSYWQARLQAREKSHIFSLSPENPLHTRMWFLENREDNLFSHKTFITVQELNFPLGNVSGDFPSQKNLGIFCLINIFCIREGSFSQCPASSEEEQMKEEHGTRIPFAFLDVALPLDFSMLHESHWLF